MVIKLLLSVSYLMNQSQYNALQSTAPIRDLPSCIATIRARAKAAAGRSSGKRLDFELRDLHLDKLNSRNILKVLRVGREQFESALDGLRCEPNVLNTKVCAAARPRKPC